MKALTDEMMTDSNSSPPIDILSDNVSKKCEIYARIRPYGRHKKVSDDFVDGKWFVCVDEAFKDAVGFQWWLGAFW